MESPSIALECFEALTLIGDFFLPYIVNSSAEEGWMRDQRKSRSDLPRADGVVLAKEQHHPGRSKKEASRIFSWGRGHPSSAEEGSSLAPDVR
jgi:hypothetical protein